MRAWACSASASVAAAGVGVGRIRTLPAPEAAQRRAGCPRPVRAPETECAVASPQAKRRLPPPSRTAAPPLSTASSEETGKRVLDHGAKTKMEKFALGGRKEGESNKRKQPWEERRKRGSTDARSHGTTITGPGTFKVPSDAGGLEPPEWIRMGDAWMHMDEAIAWLRKRDAFAWPAAAGSSGAGCQEQEAPVEERTCAICLESLPAAGAGAGRWFTCVPREKAAGEGSGWTGCCGTDICGPCFSKHLTQEISDGKTVLRCPGQCRRSLGDAEVKEHVDAAKMLRLEKARALRSNHDLRQCPSCGCLNQGSRTAPDMTCCECSTSFCFHHDLAHAGQSCREFCRGALPRKSREGGWRTRMTLEMTTVTCPSCSARVQRTGGCSHMRCICGTQFCWRCGREPRGSWEQHDRVWGECRSVKKKAREAGLVALAPVAVPAAGALVLGLGAAVVGVAAAVATVAGPVLVIRSKLTKAKRRGRAW